MEYLHRSIHKVRHERRKAYPSLCNVFNLVGTIGFHHSHSPSLALLQNVPAIRVPSKSNAATFVEFIGSKFMPCNRVCFGPGLGFIHLNAVGFRGSSDFLEKKGCPEHEVSVECAITHDESRTLGFCLLYWLLVGLTIDWPLPRGP